MFSHPVKVSKASSYSPNFLTRFFRAAPWWVISASLTLVAMALGSLVYFGEQKRQEKLGSKFVDLPIATPKQIIEPIKPDEGIQAAPIPVEPQTLDPVDNIDPAVVDPRAMISDLNRTDNGIEDGDSAKGTSLEFSSFSELLGKHEFDVIGTGGGSGLIRGGYGTPGGGGGRPTVAVRGTQTGGPTKDTEAAVLEGLRWLARHQSSSGAWDPEKFSTQCKENGCDGAGREQYAIGCTGLALLSFISAGYDPQMSRVRWEDTLNNKMILVRDVLTRGLRFLVNEQQEDGAIGDVRDEFFYNHSIATLALCEAYKLSKSPFLKEPAQKAIDYLILHQSPAPSGQTGYLGWRYKPGDGMSDTSVTGWCVMAIKSAEMAGLRISESSYLGAMNFLQSVTDSGFRVGYRDRTDAGLQLSIPGINEDFRNHPAMTAVGMLIRAFIEGRLNDPALAKGAEMLVRDLPVWDKQSRTDKAGANGRPNDYYYWYYASLALNQYDGPDSPRRDGSLWKAWNEALTKALLPNQHRKACLSGSWDGDDRWGHAGGRIYATALNTLTLEVYYRYENAFGSGKHTGYK